MKPRVRPPLTILDAIADEKLFAPWFRDTATWAAWRAFLAALFGLQMTPDQLATYQQCTGRSASPVVPASEAWLVCGRRAGKSFILALVAVFIACFHDFRPYLSPGERGTVLVIATDRRQARTIIRYIRALLTEVPMLSRMVEHEAAESFDLSNSVTIEVGTASFRTVRGYTIVAALCDELAFWPTDNSAEPDFEILDAIRPGMATIPGAMLLCASSPYARRGALWTAHREHFAKDGDPILVWQAPTLVMNPTVPQRTIDEATERDPASAAAEYGAQFRNDIESFISREAINACVQPGVLERKSARMFRYTAFVDPSGGSNDAMTMAIAHKEGDTAILDVLRERKPPFSPEAVAQEFAELCRDYRITKIYGDRYAGEWPREQFRKHGVNYEVADKSKSELFLAFLPLVNSGAVDLLNDAKLVNQFSGLERRTSRGGRDSIDHRPGAHDDLANAAAGALVNAMSGRVARSEGRPLQIEGVSRYNPITAQLY